MGYRISCQYRRFFKIRILYDIFKIDTEINVLHESQCLKHIPLDAVVSIRIYQFVEVVITMPPKATMIIPITPNIIPIMKYGNQDLDFVSTLIGFSGR